ncbi:uncharacterized protein C8A04DRAFT_13841 [Dichotomopilus funicola]|uniref:DnaJ homologue subfamily C member 28 conserved domain-containing protein n=1 Tax=Dichotomopilus funicola TaxID=1934379 RepID=A0AAN6V070_9PEZI|nr:hypothetical protein C8A04DRAFT_13841 [Dichotomopilus funicola]
MATTPYICASCARTLRQQTLLRAQPSRPRYFSSSRSSLFPATAEKPKLPTSPESPDTANTPQHNASRSDPKSSPPSSSRSETSSSHSQVRASFPSSDPTPEPNPTATLKKSPNPDPEVASTPEVDPSPGTMTTRLLHATEHALLTSSPATRNSILNDTGFSADLKAQLLSKVATASFDSQHASALTEAGLDSSGRQGGILPESAGQGTRGIASATPWRGEEEMGDVVLRMLDDGRKPLAPGLRGKYKVPEPGSAVVVDMRLRREGRVSVGRRVAGAREKAMAYAGMGVDKGTNKVKGGEKNGLSEKEREELRREFRERFAPGARAMPNTVTGLAALANERIEDAIARGQFKDIPRGKGVERDRRADNPFIDTTEYIMNKMIKRQDMVPPWIEKQQELTKAAATFRGRLRNEWKRHVARMISARGGSLQVQIARAEAYAAAEVVYNPRARRPGETAASPANTVKTTAETAGTTEAADTTTAAAKPGSIPTGPTPIETNPEPQIQHPFRDPTWHAAETSYLTLSINNLNTLTRAYNLMAPELARKPYFSLDRELDACYADVAPLVADEIRQRASNSKVRPLGSGGEIGKGGAGAGGMGGLFGGGRTSGVSVEEGREKGYGWREFWRDLWK